MRARGSIGGGSLWWPGFGVVASVGCVTVCTLVACSVSVDDPSFVSGSASAGSTYGEEDTGAPGSEDGADGADGGEDADDDGSGAPGSGEGDTGAPGPGESCGDGVIDPGESCDGQDLGGESCEGFGFDGGVLACDGCSLDTSGCFGCGNGVLEDGEECDEGDFGGETCATQGNFYDGQLSCTPACTIDTSACLAAECGDGVVNQDSEECDGDDLDGLECADVGDYWMGSLGCSQDCSFDVGDCELAECGDGVKNQDAEECDGDDVDGKECTDVGYDWGEVGCQDDCSFDESQCLICGANLDKCQVDADCCPGLSCSGWPLYWCS